MRTHWLSLLCAASAMAFGQPAPPVWQMQDSGTTAGLRGIDSVDGTVAWASGTGGTVLRTVDGGEHWQAVASGVKSSITGLAEIGGRVVAVALDGVVLWSNDKGLSFDTAQRTDRITLTAISPTGKGQAIGFSKQGVVADLMRDFPKTSD